MIVLIENPLELLFAAIVIGVVSVIVFFIIYLRSLSNPTAKEREEYAKAIQEGMNQVDVDFEVKHPRAVFECPYDHLSCDHVDTATMTTDIMCQDCERYTGIKPPKI